MRKITIIIEDDGDSPSRPIATRDRFADLYRRLDEAQRRESHYDRCPCNPANGGSGLCMCVLPTSTGVWC